MPPDDPKNYVRHPDRLDWRYSIRPSKITVPEKANPLAKLVFSEMARQGITYDELEWRSGVLKSTFKAWRNDNAPGLASIEAALGGVGWALIPVPIGRLRHLPSEIIQQLLEIGQFFRSDEEAAAAAIATQWPAWAAERVLRMPAMIRRQDSSDEAGDDECRDP